MDANQTITLWIRQLETGDPVAAQRLWERYFDRMVGLARRKLEGAKRGLADEEDIALSAFKSFCLGARNGRFPDLRDRNNLWTLLVAMTINKSIDLIRHENRRKRGGSALSDDGGLEATRQNEPEPLSQIFSREPTPELAAEVAELFERLMQRLSDADDPQLRVIAVRRMQGDSSVEIAADLGCVTRTVERKVALIRRLWEEAGR